MFWAPGSFQTPYFTVFFRFRFHMAPSSILTPKNTVKYSVFQLSNAKNTVFYDVFTPKWSKNRPLGSSWETYVGSSWRSWGPCWLMGVHLSAKVCARCLNIAPREWPNRVSGDVWRLIFDVKVWINKKNTKDGGRWQNTQIFRHRHRRHHQAKMALRWVSIFSTIMKNRCLCFFDCAIHIWGERVLLLVRWRRIWWWRRQRWWTSSSLWWVDAIAEL